MATDAGLCTKCVHALTPKRSFTCSKCLSVLTQWRIPTKGCTACLQLRNAQASEDLVDMFCKEYGLRNEDSTNGQPTSEGCHCCKRVKKLVMDKCRNWKDKQQWRKALPEYCARCELERILAWAKDDFVAHGLADKYAELWNSYLDDPQPTRSAQIARIISRNRLASRQDTPATTTIPSAIDAGFVAASDIFPFHIHFITATLDALASTHLQSMTSSGAPTKL